MSDGMILKDMILVDQIVRQQEEIAELRAKVAELEAHQDKMRKLTTPAEHTIPSESFTLNDFITELRSLEYRFLIFGGGQFANDLADMIESVLNKVAELEAELQSFYTNTNHGYTMQDRHFNVEGNRIYDENFDHDAALTVEGDFEKNGKHEYAKMICGALNSYNAEQAISRKLYETLRGFATNYDHDNDAHKYGSECRVCAAEEAIAEYEKERE